MSIKRIRIKHVKDFAALTLTSYSFQWIQTDLAVKLVFYFVNWKISNQAVTMQWSNVFTISLHYSLQSLIFDEVDLSDASVAESSTKNVNNSFTVSSCFSGLHQHCRGMYTVHWGLSWIQHAHSKTGFPPLRILMNACKTTYNSVDKLYGQRYVDTWPIICAWWTSLCWVSPPC